MFSWNSPSQFTEVSDGSSIMFSFVAFLTEPPSPGPGCEAGLCTWPPDSMCHCYKQQPPSPDLQTVLPKVPPLGSACPSESSPALIDLLIVNLVSKSQFTQDAHIYTGCPRVTLSNTPFPCQKHSSVERHLSNTNTRTACLASSVPVACSRSIP